MKPQLRIEGGVRLAGTIAASGSKNAALPLMAASILADEPLVLEGVPRLTDVDTLTAVLDELGISATRDNAGTLRLSAIDIAPVRARYELVRRMRASFCVLGPLLARRGRAVVALPGGCNIGPRPVDLHLKGLAALGAELRIDRGYVIARARRLVGTAIDLTGPAGPTVTGTANVLSAAVLARGTTVLHGAATEPEIVDFGLALNRMGACIRGLGTSTLWITGVASLGAARWRVIPDRIEAATLLLAAATTGGAITVCGVVPAQLTAVCALLERAGFPVETEKDSVRINAHARPRPLDIVASPYPGLPSDVQAQVTALLCFADGRSTVGDRVFPARFMHAAELARLGARVSVRAGQATVEGVERLRGAAVTACDLRASAALILAGLAAEGTTVVRAIHHLDRGYELLDAKLAALGANIERSDDRGAGVSLNPAHSEG